jgi:hypothetical protein
VFLDPEYVKWTEETVHVLSYDLDPNAEAPEPMVEVERDGEKVSVFAAYPMFTPGEMTFLLGELGKRVDFPTKTPWSGVLSPDGKQRLGEVGRATAKEFRALYEAGQKKLGAPLERKTWLRVRELLKASADADFDEDWKKAVTAALEARGLEKGLTQPLVEAIEARIASLEGTCKDRVRDARKEKDAAKSAAALAKLRADFAGLPCAEDAK